jgi:hypothetical protein
MFRVVLEVSSLFLFRAIFFTASYTSPATGLAMSNPLFHNLPPLDE